VSRPTVAAAVLFGVVGLAGLVLGRNDLVGLWLLGYLVGLPAVEVASVGVRAVADRA
jgi:hypothetical protein